MSSQHLQTMMSLFEKWSATVSGSSAFAVSVVSLVVEHAFTPSMLKAKSLTTRYEQMWAGYHQLITGDELSSLWRSAFDNVENPFYFHAVSD